MEGTKIELDTNNSYNPNNTNINITEQVKIKNKNIKKAQKFLVS